MQFFVIRPLHWPEFFVLVHPLYPFRACEESSLNRIKMAFVLALILITSTAASALALRGYFDPTGEFQAFDIPTGQLGTIFSFSLSDNISLPTNNFTILYNPQS